MAARDPAPDDPKGFLDRWSARKRAARRGDPALEPAPQQASAAAPEGQSPEGQSPEDAERELIESLPDLDSLGPGSDFRPFMQKGVPARLRTAALRKLWRSNPVLANLDGLNDYDTDYTDAKMVVPNLRSAYQVGRGFLNRARPLEPPADATAGSPLEVAEVAPSDEAAPLQPSADPAGPADED